MKPRLLLLIVDSILNLYKWLRSCFHTQIMSILGVNYATCPLHSRTYDKLVEITGYGWWQRCSQRTFLDYYCAKMKHGQSGKYAVGTTKVHSMKTIAIPMPSYMYFKNTIKTSQPCMGRSKVMNINNLLNCCNSEILRNICTQIVFSKLQTVHFIINFKQSVYVHSEWTRIFKVYVHSEWT